MQIFKNPSFQIVNKQKNALLGSSVFIVIALVMLFIQGINMGIDFTGGARAKLTFNKEITSQELREAFANSAFSSAEIKSYNATQLSMTIKTDADFGNDELNSQINSVVAANLDGYNLVEEPSISQISGKMSDEMLERSMEAIEFALVLIALYIIVRFSSRHTMIGIAGFLIDYALYKFVWSVQVGIFIPLFVLYPIIFKAGFAFGALVAVFHDIIITISLLEIFGIEFSAAVIAALLTIIGYSLNDTIVVFDRIRENLEEVTPETFDKDEFHGIVNRSINNTLNRTVVTSLTTFFVVFVLSLFGGEPIRPFSITLCIGVLVGTYSSVFIAAPIMMKRYEGEMSELKDKLENEDETKQAMKNNDGIVL